LHKHHRIIAAFGREKRKGLIPKARGEERTKKVIQLAAEGEKFFIFLVYRKDGKKRRKKGNGTYKDQTGNERPFGVKKKGRAPIPALRHGRVRKKRHTSPTELY